MSFALRGRKIGTITYGAGQTNSLLIDRDGVVAEYFIRLRYTLTIGGGGNAVGPFFQTLARPIQRLTVQIGGRDTVVDLSGEMLALRALFDYGTPAQGMSDSVVLTAGSATAYDIILPLARFMPRGRRPDDCGDDLRNTSQATIAITWGPGTGADQFTTPQSGTAMSSVSCDIYANYLVADRSVPFNGMVRDLREVVAQPQASNTSYATIIDSRSGYFISSILVATLDDSIGSNAILNNLQVVQGSWTWLDLQAAMLRGRNKVQYSLESLATGAYAWDARMFGEFTQMVNTDPNKVSADLQLVQDITFASSVTTLKYSIESMRPPAWL
jgi:hypothetical protein